MAALDGKQKAVKLGRPLFLLFLHFGPGAATGGSEGGLATGGLLRSMGEKWPIGPLAPMLLLWMSSSWS